MKIKDPIILLVDNDGYPVEVIGDLPDGEIFQIMRHYDKERPDDAPHTAWWIKNFEKIEFTDKVEEISEQNQYLGGIKKNSSLYKQIESEIRTSPIVNAVYNCHMNQHGDIINIHECLVDMVKHMVQQEIELKKWLTTKLLNEPIRCKIDHHSLANIKGTLTEEVK